MRKFAFFLPQFHTIPENDEWWGKNFTEWANVKTAKPLFEGHKQPQVPLNNNYYNLLDKSTVQWQTSLLKEYHIQGLIYYHYWFQGKKLLEKPAENLLRWNDIKQPFFFCWANHSWKKSWNGSSDILLEQKYGCEKNWEEHFQYLLPFFKDPRYEKKDNRPLFMLFICSFPEKKKMLDFFDKRCKESGFNGIHIIETITFSEKETPLDFFKNAWDKTSNFFLREPSTSIIYHSKDTRFSIFWLKVCLLFLLDKIKIHPFVITRSGDELYSCMIKHLKKRANWIHGIFFCWDNTPRHKKRGYVITEVSEKKFAEYINKIKDEEYLFINAWNEWAEGMMLEPTKENGFKYLEWIKKYT